MMMMNLDFHNLTLTVTQCSIHCSSYVKNKVKPQYDCNLTTDLHSGEKNKKKVKEALKDPSKDN